MTNLKIDIKNGLVEVEDDKELASKVYTDFKDVLIDRMQQASEPEDAIAPAEPPSQKAKAKTKVSGGPSCASRIEELKKANFFKSLQDIKAIAAALAAKAQNYQSNQIGAALTTLTKRGALRRIKQDGVYKYQNP
jgi:hypothetical protein